MQSNDIDMPKFITSTGQKSFAYIGNQIYGILFVRNVSVSLAGILKTV